MSERRFDPAEHKYFLDDAEIPSVTQVLGDLGLDGAGPWYKDQHRRKGDAIHRMCAYIGQGIWDPEATHPELVPYGRAFERFLADYQFTPEVIERPLYSETYRIGGTLDAWGFMPSGKVYEGTGGTFDRVLVDIKSGQLQPSAHLQTALYALLAKEELGLDTDARCALRLCPESDVPYRVRWGNGQDTHVALAALSLWWWRTNHKMWRGGKT